MSISGWVLLFWGVVTLANGNLGYQIEGGMFKPLATFAGNTVIGWAFVIVGFDLIFNNIVFKTISQLAYFIFSRVKTEKIGYKPDEGERTDDQRNRYHYERQPPRADT